MPNERMAEAVPDIDAEALPQLTPQQLSFARLVASGKTAADAYRAAYNADDFTDNTIWANASRLRHNDKVQAWIRAGQRAAADVVKMDAGEYASYVQGITQEAKEAGSYGAAVSGAKLLGQVNRLFATDVNITHRSGDLGDVLAVLESVLQADTMALIHRDLGVTATVEDAAKPLITLDNESV